MNLSKEIASMYDDAVRIRQDLHRIPEIGFQLHDTQAYVLNELRQCAPDRLETLAVCGVKAVFFAKDAQKTIALRADMDGIHNDEANDVPYRSQTPGMMHACGHDVHTAVLMGALQELNRSRDFEGTLLGLFQPGEECNPGGASLVLAEKPFEGYDVRAVVGEHVEPQLEVGTLGFRAGKYMAASDELRFRVRGTG